MEGYPPETGGDNHGKQDKSDFTGPLLAGPGRAASGALGAAMATAVALAAFVAIGSVAWHAVTGLQGIGICGALGAAAGAALGSLGPRAARIIGGGIGGVVAAYFALAFGEVMPPGTMQWALSGAAYAALFALPVAALVGDLIGLSG